MKIKKFENIDYGDEDWDEEDESDNKNFILTFYALRRSSRNEYIDGVSIEDIDKYLRDKGYLPNEEYFDNPENHYVGWRERIRMQDYHSIHFLDIGHVDSRASVKVKEYKKTKI